MKCDKIINIKMRATYLDSITNITYLKNGNPVRSPVNTVDRPMPISCMLTITGQNYRFFYVYTVHVHKYT